jgi:hypothetical protein
MNAARAYADLRRLGLPVVTTEDVSLRLRLSRSAASRLLSRLSAVELVVRIRHGLWSLEARIDPLAIAEYLTAPFPAYLSFHTALYLHGMIGQIPRIITVASLARPQRIETALGTYSVHRVPPELLGGYEHRASGVRIATPEKALIDFLYLSNARSRLFASLPELYLDEGFDSRAARRWIARIPDRRRRTMARRRLDAILAAQRESGRAGTRARRPVPARRMTSGAA